jgi:hypothetical protein
VQAFRRRTAAAPRIVTGSSEPGVYRRARRRLIAPLLRYFDARFERIDERLDHLERSADAWDRLSRIDVSEHNAGRAPPAFDRVVSQVVSASQFSHPDFDRLRRLLYPGTVTLPWGGFGRPGTPLHRKVWEYVYVLRAAEQQGVLRADCRGIGFGVGLEPIPATLASHGVTVLATDLPGSAEQSASWTTTGQHLLGIEALSNHDVISDDDLRQRVVLRYVDMNAVPDDLGLFDLVWSCCALEHLGSPERGLEFVLRTLELLRPGGVSVHTTELELTRRHDTADYGNLAVYRIDDLDGLADEVRRRGFEMETNWYVSMESPADRWIAVPPSEDPAHLKLTIGDSISTSVGILVRRPEDSGSVSAGHDVRRDEALGSIP